MSDELLWVAVICAVPFLAFGAVKAAAARRRGRAKAVARRSKSRAGSGRA